MKNYYNAISVFCFTVFSLSSVLGQVLFDLAPLSGPQSQITYDFNHTGTSEVTNFDMENDGDQDVLLMDYF